MISKNKKKKKHKLRRKKIGKNKLRLWGRKEKNKLKKLNEWMQISKRSEKENERMKAIIVKIHK